MHNSLDELAVVHRADAGNESEQTRENRARIASCSSLRRYSRIGWYSRVARGLSSRSHACSQAWLAENARPHIAHRLLRQRPSAILAEPYPWRVARCRVLGRAL